MASAKSTGVVKNSKRANNFRDLTGLTFGRWAVIAFARRRGGGNNAKNYWLVECTCLDKTRREVPTSQLTLGVSQSCGCLRRERLEASRKNRRHGGCKTPEYSSWSTMKRRCLSKTMTGYSNYGGRGIKVCERWLCRDGFVNFLADMGRRPSKSHTIERKDNDGDYKPDNCVWATKKAQANNRRNTVTLTLGGVTKKASEWAEEIGVSRELIYYRIKAGWAVEDILGRPPCRSKI